MMPRILIADDHEIVREGIRTLLARARPAWQVCGEVKNGMEAIAAVKDLKPDVLILDITMPVLSGLEALIRIKELGLDCRILLFTMHESNSLTGEARNAGAQGYVLKSQAARDLILAIETVLAGGTFFGAPAPAKRRPDRDPNNGKRGGSRKAFPFRRAPSWRARAQRHTNARVVCGKRPRTAVISFSSD